MISIEGKKISIIGAARSGIAAAELALRKKAIPFVSDSGDEKALTESLTRLRELQVQFEIGHHSEKVFDCDLMVISPGVPTNSDIIKIAKSKNIRVISELEFASFFCEGKIVAITGTNGKTTTTSLTGHLLTTAGIKNYIAGNIGNAFSNIADKIQPEEYAVLEVSSFQLDLIESFKPLVSAILNITPDHLNRYDNELIKYAKSKQRIYENQTESDYLIINIDSPILMENLNQIKAKTFYFSTQKTVERGCYLSENKILFVDGDESSLVCNTDDLLIKGEHNIQNAMCGIIVGKILSINNEIIRKSLSTFKGVEHRIEFVRTLNGISFYNDSKATNVDSVAVALKSFDKPILLILGGQDKGNDYSIIEDLVKDKVKKIYAIGESADKIYDYFHKKVLTQKCSDFSEIVQFAIKDAAENDVVLLSPACASFDMFDNYEHRGRVFKEIVNSL
jgi:UDP-N-acetylmuramoylalanine--D-glutamate ligase